MELDRLGSFIGVATRRGYAYIIQDLDIISYKQDDVVMRTVHKCCGKLGFASYRNVLYLFDTEESRWEYFPLLGLQQSIRHIRLYKDAIVSLAPRQIVAHNWEGKRLWSRGFGEIKAFPQRIGDFLYVLPVRQGLMYIINIHNGEIVSTFNLSPYEHSFDVCKDKLATLSSKGHLRLYLLNGSSNPSLLWVGNLKEEGSYLVSFNRPFCDKLAAASINGRWIKVISVNKRSIPKWKVSFKSKIADLRWEGNELLMGLWSGHVFSAVPSANT
ncbi:hypothetical protein IPA_02190 [Ignicoccus pacificus DSM 13166]|uniref:Uncharacterized protein n=1 Tax=Ignicoccus pacificus DSM 13166 TaxID=940294 RepID=A0A977PKL9_9CREN|nr:hypothetical protein IPA_02190 [Ignicoccus pacificus DSM 13166]